MKYLYLMLLLLFSSNIIAQSRIVRVNTSTYKEKSLTDRRAQTKNIQEEIDAQGMSSTLVGKAILPIRYQFKSKELKLNGAGLREMLWVDLYACGLYLTNKNINAANIVSTNKDMVIRLDILSNAISKKKLIKAFEKGFAKSNTPQVAIKYRRELAKFISFLDVDIKIGDKYDIVYTPGVGTSLYVNYEKKGTIKGLAFKSAIFNIWLSSDPADKSLKKDLLSI